MDFAGSFSKTAKTEKPQIRSQLFFAMAIDNQINDFEHLMRFTVMNARPELTVIAVALACLYMINGIYAGFICNFSTVIPSVLLTLVIKDLKPMPPLLTRSIMVFWTLLGIGILGDYMCEQIPAYFTLKFMLLESALFCVHRKVLEHIDRPIFSDGDSIPLSHNSLDVFKCQETHMDLPKRDGIINKIASNSMVPNHYSNVFKSVENMHSDCTSYEELQFFQKLNTTCENSLISSVENSLHFVRKNTPSFILSVSTKRITLRSVESKIKTFELRNSGNCSIMWLMKTNSINYVVALPTKGVLEQGRVCKILIEVHGTIRKETKKPKLVFEYVPVDSEVSCYKREFMNDSNVPKAKAYVSLQIR